MRQPDLFRTPNKPWNAGRIIDPKLKDKIATLRAQMQALKAMEAQVSVAPDGQVSLTDPDARSMATSGRGSGIVGYNVQSVVEAEHHLIVAHDVRESHWPRANDAASAMSAHRTGLAPRSAW
jgi:hypothetical protein